MTWNEKECVKANNDKEWVQVKGRRGRDVAVAARSGRDSQLLVHEKEEVWTLTLVTRKAEQERGIVVVLPLIFSVFVFGISIYRTETRQ